MRTFMVIASMVMSACAMPASVEGVLSNEGFQLQSERPLTTPTASGRDMIVVLAERDGETLSTVVVVVPHVAELALGDPVEVGSGAWGDARPSIAASVGALLIETRADGVELISSVDPIRSGSVSGSLTLDERNDERLAGTFRVSLDDGGYLDGAFVATPGG